jgi:hypothetical protein
MEMSIQYVNPRRSSKAVTKWVEGACFSAFVFSFAILICELGITPCLPFLVGLGFLRIYSTPSAVLGLVYCRMWMFVIVVSMNRESMFLCT